MRLQSIQIKNFKSFRSVDLEFPQGIFFITGKNRDEFGVMVNAVGKTNFIDAIKWCLFDIFENEEVNLPRWGMTKAEVALKIENPDLYIVHRKTLMADELIVELEGNRVKGKNKNEIRHRLFLELGIRTKLNDVVYNTCIISDRKSFFALDKIEQQELITKYLKTDILSKYRNIAQNKAKDILSHIEKFKYQLPMMDDINDIGPLVKELGMKQGIYDKYIQMQETMKKNQYLTCKINDTKAVIEDYNELLNEALKLLKDAQFEYAELHREFNLTKQCADYSEDKYLIRKQDIIAQIATIQNEVDDRQMKIVEKENLLKGIYICPGCKSQLVIDKDNNLQTAGDDDIMENLSNDKDRLIGQRMNLTVKLNKLKRSLKWTEDTLARIVRRRKAYELFEINKVKLKKISQSISKIKNVLIYRKRQLRSFQSQIVNQECQFTSDNFDELINEIEDLKIRIIDVKNRNKYIHDQQSLIKRIKSQINLLEQQYQEYADFMAIMLQIRDESVNQFVSYLSVLINQYLYQLGVQERILISNEKDSFYSIWNGIRKGNVLVSMGKRERINFIQMLALRDILNGTFNYPFEFLISDGVMSNIDNTGVESIIKILESENIQSLLVLQRSLDIYDEYPQLVIERRDDVSSITLR